MTKTSTPALDEIQSWIDTGQAELRRSLHVTALSTIQPPDFVLGVSSKFVAGTIMINPPIARALTITVSLLLGGLTISLFTALGLDLLSPTSSPAARTTLALASALCVLLILVLSRPILGADGWVFQGWGSSHAHALAQNLNLLSVGPDGYVFHRFTHQGKRVTTALPIHTAIALRSKPSGIKVRAPQHGVAMLFDEAWDYCTGEPITPDEVLRRITILREMHRRRVAAEQAH